ncbi:hypothetical protein CR513_00370, partial [Mucuna pruriens]
MRPSTTYGMIPTYGDFVMIKLFVSAFLMSRSIRSSSFVMQHLEATTMNQLGRSGKYLIVGSIGRPFLGTRTNSSTPVKNAKKLEWPLVEDMRCLNNPYCFAKSLMFGTMCQDVWGINFIEATKTNDAKVVVDFLKSNIFCRFGVPKVLISD